MKTKYMYKYNYIPQNRELAKYEIEQIFGEVYNDNLVFSDININPNKSYFLNYQLEIMYCAQELSNVLEQIKAANLYYEGFKIEFIDVSDETMAYQERIQTCIDISWLIEGYGTMKDVKITLVLTKQDGYWYFGKLSRNNRQYLENKKKPHSYSNAMTSELSRTLVNIACGKQKNVKLVDPCCGIGTVVIEALSQNIDIEAYELNYEVAKKAQENLEALGMKNVISHQDMHTINSYYDVAIMDLPYGLFSITSLELQTGLVTKCYDLADRLLLVANERSEKMISTTNWIIDKMIKVPKKGNGPFERYIYCLIKDYDVNTKTIGNGN